MNHPYNAPRPLSQGQQFEKTQAEYYTSALYPEPMTIEYINSAPPNRIPTKRGQVPAPFNRWNPFDNSNMVTNNWFWSYNDKFMAGCLGMSFYRFQNTDFQPRRDDWSANPRVYDDDIFGQTIAGILIGAQIGAAFSWAQCANIGSEAGIFQSGALMPNTWMPLHKANFWFRFGMFRALVFQCAAFGGTYAFVDGCLSQYRQKDDFWNSLWGGIATAPVLTIWYRSLSRIIQWSTIFGFMAASARFARFSKDARKPCLDFDRPYWGVSGPTWLTDKEPHYYTMWTFFNPKYREFGNMAFG